MLINYATVPLTKECSSQIQNRTTNIKDSGSFTVRITIEKSINAQGLCDLWDSINLMLTLLFKNIG